MGAGVKAPVSTMTFKDLAAWLYQLYREHNVRPSLILAPPEIAMRWKQECPLGAVYSDADNRLTLWGVPFQITSTSDSVEMVTVLGKKFSYKEYQHESTD